MSNAIFIDLYPVTLWFLIFWLLRGVAQPPTKYKSSGCFQLLSWRMLKAATPTDQRIFWKRLAIHQTSPSYPEKLLWRLRAECSSSMCALSGQWCWKYLRSSLPKLITTYGFSAAKYVPCLSIFHTFACSIKTNTQHHWEPLKIYFLIPFNPHAGRSHPPSPWPPPFNGAPSNFGAAVPCGHLSAF